MLAQELAMDGLSDTIGILHSDAVIVCHLMHCRSIWSTTRIFDSDCVALLQRNRCAVICLVAEPVSAIGLS